MRSPHGVATRTQAPGRGATTIVIRIPFVVTFAFVSTQPSLLTPARCTCTGIDESGCGGSNSIVCRTCAESGRAAKRRAAARSGRMSRLVRNARAARLVVRLDAVVRRFLRDHHVVGVRLAQAGGGDADELRLRAQVLDVLRAGEAHAGTKADR